MHCSISSMQWDSVCDVAVWFIVPSSVVIGMLMCCLCACVDLICNQFNPCVELSLSVCLDWDDGCACD